MRRPVSLFLAALAVLGCESPTYSPTTSVPLAPTAARATVDTHSRANLVWEDQVNVGGSLTAAGIRGDGRNRFGQAAAPFNEYLSDFCGVRGFLYDQKGENGNLVFDPDTYYDATTMALSCGAARSLSFYLNGSAGTATTGGPDMIVKAIWSMAVGEVRLQPILLAMSQLPCMIDFDAAYSGASNARVTRLANGVDASGAVVRRWRLESQGNHTAACVTSSSSGKYVDTGARHLLPFAVTVTQVLYPDAVYP